MTSRVAAGLAIGITRRWSSVSISVYMRWFVRLRPCSRPSEAEPSVSLWIDAKSSSMRIVPTGSWMRSPIFAVRSSIRTTGAAFEGRDIVRSDAAELLAIFRVLQVELIARRAYQRVLLDPAFMDCFRTDESIHAVWASRHRADLWGAPMNLESTVRNVFDHHKTEVLQQVLRLER